MVGFSRLGWIWNDCTFPNKTVFSLRFQYVVVIFNQFSWDSLRTPTQDPLRAAPGRTSGGSFDLYASCLRCSDHTTGVCRQGCDDVGIPGRCLIYSSLSDINSLLHIKSMPFSFSLSIYRYMYLC